MDFGDEEDDALISDIGAPSSNGLYFPPKTNVVSSTIYGILGKCNIKPELVQGTVVRLYYSRLTAGLYCATVVLAGGLLAITLGFNTPLRDQPMIIFCLEAAVTLSLFVEVALRVIVLGDEYLQSWSNILDCTVALASTILLFSAAPKASKAMNYQAQREDVELGQSLILFRTVVQFARIALIAQHARRSRESKGATDVSFADIDLDFSVLREQALKARNVSNREDSDGL